MDGHAGRCASFTLVCKRSGGELDKLRVIEKMRRFISDADKSTWKIRITLASGQSVMTVISRGVAELPQRPFGKRAQPVNHSQKPSL